MVCETICSNGLTYIVNSKKNHQWCWRNASQQAFDKLKQRLISSPVLAYPDFKYSFTLDVDGEGLGAVLLQVIDGEEKVIAYASRMLMKQE